MAVKYCMWKCLIRNNTEANPKTASSADTTADDAEYANVWFGLTNDPILRNQTKTVSSYVGWGTYSPFLFVQKFWADFLILWMRTFSAETVQCPYISVGETIHKCFTTDHDPRFWNHVKSFRGCREIFETFPWSLCEQPLETFRWSL